MVTIICINIYTINKHFYDDFTAHVSYFIFNEAPVLVAR